jgi:hypothetical protein
MPRGLGLAALAVVVLAAAAGDARAQRRPVAVIDLSGEPAVEKLAKDLERELNGHPELSQVVDSTLSSELIGQPADDDRRRLDQAVTSLSSAQAELEKFSFTSAAIHTSTAESALFEVTPSLAVTLLADLAFVQGRTRLGQSDGPAALEQFALSYRLNPKRVLDPARVLPEEVEAWKKAQVAVQGTSTLSVKGTGRLWVDGVDLGPVGGPVEVVPGLHVVSLSGPERQTRTKTVRAAAGTAQAIEIEDAPATERLKVRRARLALRAAPDATARASLMANLAAMLGVRDAILLGLTNGKVTVQTWRDQAPGFSARRDVGEETPARILEGLAPKALPKETQPPIIITPPPPKDPWYSRAWVQATGVGVAAIIISVIAVAIASGDTFPGDGDPAIDPVRR